MSDSDFVSDVDTIPDLQDAPCPSQFDALIEQVREGDNEAARQLLEAYEPHIVRVIRRRMNSQMRKRFDSQDFTQAVWASFFGNLPDVSRFRRANELVNFLCRVASNKVIDAGRRVAVRMEQSGDPMIAAGHTAADLRVGISEPTPSQNAVARESYDRLLLNEKAIDCQVIELRSHGLTQLEIAEKLGISERQVRRTMNRISKKAYD